MGAAPVDHRLCPVSGAEESKDIVVFESTGHSNQLQAHLLRNGDTQSTVIEDPDDRARTRHCPKSLVWLADAKDL
jgi:hypothetical protein